MATEYIKVGMNEYLNHPSQRELIKAFMEYGKIITPRHVQKYFEMRGDELMFVNQKIGFVYSYKVRELEAA